MISFPSFFTGIGYIDSGFFGLKVFITSDSFSELMKSWVGCILSSFIMNILAMVSRLCL